MRNRLNRLLNSDSLKARCARGGAVLGAGAVVERGARFVRSMILARILAPDQFGLMALVMAAGGLFEVLTEVGVREAIVQNKRGDSKEFLNVAWWFSAVRGVLLYFIGLAVVPWVAHFYREPLLESLLQVSFLTMLFSGLTSTKLYALQKNLQFGWYVWITQGSGLAGTIISLVAVWFVPNVWALVAGLVAEAAIRCLASFVLCPIRPCLTFDRECSRELFAFARGMFGLPILTFVVMQADVFVLGRVCSKEALGMYSLAMALASMPLMVFARVAQPLILPVLSGVKSDTPRLRETFLRMTDLVFTFGIALTVCFAVFSESLISLVYGPRYAAIGTTFAILCGYSLFYMLSTLFASTYMAIGRPELHRRFMILWLLLVVLMIYPAAAGFGPVGVAAVLWLCLALASVCQVRRLGLLIGFSPIAYMATARAGTAAGLIAGGAAALVRFELRLSEAAQLATAVALCSGACAVGAWRASKGIPKPAPSSLPSAALSAP